ncbi:PREDICTED: uncharacterized protein LOC108567212 [Nicrophorus vespilloides]|uniref:Uncharacterized protein LOC108567212 n=1 Tax=Nicrophorus vespilloides TaxID=110193 RepID=A0ABM1N887_NICVS|nr:PREDICTED: uncharacterized protein LOC108567212 [Nicrophorus vespilloides]
MKFVCCFVLLVASIIARAFVLEENYENLFKIIKEKCVAEVHVDKSIVDRLDSDVPFPTMEELKCYTQCLYTKYGLFDDDGTLIGNKFSSFLPVELYGKEKAAAKICIKNNMDRCKASYDTHKCYLHLSFHPDALKMN